MDLSQSFVQWTFPTLPRDGGADKMLERREEGPRNLDQSFNSLTKNLKSSPITYKSSFDKSISRFSKLKFEDDHDMPGHSLNSHSLNSHRRATSVELVVACTSNAYSGQFLITTSFNSTSASLIYIPAPDGFVTVICAVDVSNFAT